MSQTRTCSSSGCKRRLVSGRCRDPRPMTGARRRPKTGEGEGISTISLVAEMKPEELAVLEGYMGPVTFPQGVCIFRQEAAGEDCYLIDEGQVRLEVEQPEVDSDGVLGYLEPGMFLGEFSLLDRMPRSASAYADTDVRARRLSAAALESLCVRHPDIGL